MTYRYGTTSAIWLLLFFPLGALHQDYLVNESVDVGSKAPTFYLKSLDGGEFFLSRLVGEPITGFRKESGKKTVVLSFFATWCIPCKGELPLLERIYREYSNESLNGILIDVEENENKVKAYIDSLGLNIPVLMDFHGVVAQKYNVVALPTLLIINKDGIIELRSFGYKGEDHFRALITNKLDELL